MEKNHEGEEAKKCCHSGRCGGKTVAAIVLILLGWIVGYLMGSGGGLCRNKGGMYGHEGMGMSCPMMGDAQAPAKK